MKKAILLIGALTVMLSGCIKETFPMSDSATAAQVGASPSALTGLVSAIPAQMVQGYLVYGGQEWEFDMDRVKEYVS